MARASSCLDLALESSLPTLSHGITRKRYGKVTYHGDSFSLRHLQYCGQITMAFPVATFSLRGGQSNAALLISPFEQDHKALQSLFREQGWTLHGAGSLESALKLLRQGVASVVITEKDLPIGNWKDVLGAVRHLSSSPLVVATRAIGGSAFPARS